MSARLYYEKEEKKITTIKGYIELETDFTQLYYSFQKLIPKMKSIIEFGVLMYFCINSGKNGTITTTEQDYNNFLQDYINNGGPSVSKVTFHACIKNLHKNKIIIKVSRGSYQVNPVLIWKDSIQERRDIITDIIESSPLVKEKYMIE